MFWSFLILCIVVSLSLLYFIFWASIRIYRITIQKTKNTFRFCQYTLFLYHLLMIIVTLGIKFIDDFELQNYPFFLHIYFSYYFSEIINIACWVNFLTHMSYYSSTKDLNEVIIFRVKRKEKTLLGILIGLFILFAIPLLTLQILAFINWCTD